MIQPSIAVAEHLYSVDLKFTKVTDFGVSLEAIVSQQAPPPPQGARFDIEFQGRISGEKLNGQVSGVDYIYIRADGRVELHIHALIATDDGERVAFFADGVANPDPATGVFQLRENGTFNTASQRYSWLNPLQVWGSGTVDPIKGEVSIKGYAA